MRNGEKNSIARQLTDLGEEIRKTDPDETERILDTTFKAVVRLMTIVTKIDQDTATMTEKTVSERIRAYRSLMDKALAFSEGVAGRPLTDEQQRQIAELNAGADTASENFRYTQSLLEAAQRRRTEEEGKYKAAQIAYELNKSMLESLEQEERDLEIREQACTSEHLVQLQSDIIQQKLTLEKREKQEEKLGAELQDWKTRIAELESVNRGIQKQIDDQPEALQKRQREYERLTTQLAQIMNAETECSDEKQQEIRGKIEEETPVKERLEREKQVLDGELARIRALMSRLDEEKDRRKIEIMPILREAIEKVGAAAGKMEGDLLEAKERADRFSEKIDHCRELYAQYHEWYDSIADPMTALIEQIRRVVIPETENTRLLQTLDPDGCEMVHQLLENTRKNLADLDVILASVVNAAEADQRDTEKRAETMQEA